VSICGKAVSHVDFQDWKLSTGSIPAVAVTSLLASYDVIIFSQFGSLPKRHQPKWRTNEKVSGAQEKGVGGTGEGCQMPSNKNVELGGRDGFKFFIHCETSYMLPKVRRINGGW
jgi:hypothetical protein